MPSAAIASARATAVHTSSDELFAHRWSSDDAMGGREPSEHAAWKTHTHIEVSTKQTHNIEHKIGRDIQDAVCDGASKSSLAG
mmetsp:Transcript_26526/g.58132  ORF Transcript_26526/g.58132 Transcript_26526/m.58132 type:complete len:83 (+) Transcript_26526:1614-1862(+)